MTISIVDVILSIIDIDTRYRATIKQRGDKMARETLQTLSEPMYYVLLALMEERCGVDIMQQVEYISNERINIGPGTLYAMLDKFLTNGIIEQTRLEGRKRWYIINDLGKDMLIKEYERLCKMKQEGELILGGVTNE